MIKAWKLKLPDKYNWYFKYCGRLIIRIGHNWLFWILWLTNMAYRFSFIVFIYLMDFNIMDFSIMDFNKVDFYKNLFWYCGIQYGGFQNGGFQNGGF